MTVKHPRSKDMAGANRRGSILGVHQRLIGGLFIREDPFFKIRMQTKFDLVYPRSSKECFRRSVVLVARQPEF